MWTDLKYLVAYVAPLAAAVGLYLGGIWSFGAWYVGFLLIPMLEFFLPARPSNVPAEEEKQRNGQKFFDILLYLHLPIIYGLLGYFVYRLSTTVLAWYEILGMTLSMGVIIGSYGINVAHELGHRNDQFSQWVARLLLVPSLYTHFTIEHNIGHHRHVGTPDDPATARLGESLYAFWVRSVTGSFLNAWKLERRRLGKCNKQFFSISNQLLWGVVLEILYLCIVMFFGGLFTLILVLCAAIMGFLLLETVNYIEHYGLLRKQLSSGQYEPVEAMHSWNSNHELGRIFLYELTRHPDHHYKANRHYQILRHHDGAPQLPTGYPGTMLLAMFPWWWRKVMHTMLKSADTSANTNANTNANRYHPDTT